MGLRSTIQSAINAAWTATGDASTGVKTAVVLYHVTAEGTYSPATDSYGGGTTEAVEVEAIRYDETVDGVEGTVMRTYLVRGSDLTAMTGNPSTDWSIKEGTLATVGSQDPIEVVDVETDPTQQIFMVRTHRINS